MAREQLAAAGAATGVARAAGVAEKAAAERLLQEALRRGSLDNTTGVVHAYAADKQLSARVSPRRPIRVLECRFELTLGSPRSGFLDPPEEPQALPRLVKFQQLGVTGRRSV